ncbi:LysR substrate-binding domain-containing protein [Paraburkholderia sp. J41]|uniref:LysR family transcriptional regulator n=1 Tax=Paraburkholderia sp. J41 TaxID=2805433 RepID=UPI002AC3692A|nr:LysR substrate-binding domain-containing protein [Paraburkholderia sp. J41]
MELRQLRYFIKVVEHGGLGRAAAELGMVTSALSQQISRLESELATRLLTRTATGVVPTDAGIAFLRQAQLAVRHADNAIQSAGQARLTGHVSVGLPPTTASVLARPLLDAMRERYPEVRVHLVEALSGHLGNMLNARQLDLAVMFRSDAGHRWSVLPLLDERLFLITRSGTAGLPPRGAVRLRELGQTPLVLPSSSHGLRALLDTAFARARVAPPLAAEVDGLTVLMDLVQHGFGATIQPGAATARLGDQPFDIRLVRDDFLHRPNLLASLSDDELSPAALAVRVLLAQVAAGLVKGGLWPGATLHE